MNNRVVAKALPGKQVSHPEGKIEDENEQKITEKERKYGKTLPTRGSTESGYILVRIAMLFFIHAHIVWRWSQLSRTHRSRRLWHARGYSDLGLDGSLPLKPRNLYPLLRVSFTEKNIYTHF